jgi:ATP-dependent helicase/nuclease subunit A
MSAASHQILRASAGTGKTYALVEAYLALVDEGDLRPSEIIAISFTRKAALELRQRIRARLRSAGATQDVLAELAQAPIGNFHGLALRLLRSLGRGAALPEGFEVLGEEGDDGQLFTAACHSAWFSGEPTVSRAVTALAAHLSVDAKLPGALWQAVSRVREDGEPLDSKALLGTYDWQRLQAEQHRNLLQLRELLRAGISRQTEKGASKIEACLAEAVPDPQAPVVAWAAAWQRVTRHLDRRGRLGEIYTPAHAELAKEGVLLSVAGELCSRLVEPLAVVVDSALAEYVRAKARLRAVDFGDLVERLTQVLSREPEVHSEMRARVKAVLVDEAQDTNRLQRQLVHLLAGLSGPAAGKSPPARLFVVGDRKQAIYTFRGADPASFESFVADVHGIGGSERPLTKSKRSSPELVASINGLGQALFGERYEALVPDPDPARGRVAIHRPGMTWLEVAEVEGGAVAQTAAEAVALAAWVRGQVDKGGSAGDYALLLPVTTRARLYASALASVGIPAIVGGGAALYARPEVVDVISMMAWLVDEDDRLSAAVALRSPLVGLSEAALLALLTEQEAGIDRLDELRRGVLGEVETGIASDGSALAMLERVLPELVLGASFLGPAALLAELERRLAVRAVLLGLDAGEQRVANLDRLTELARQYEERRRGGVRAFVRRELDRVTMSHQEPVAPVPAGLRHVVTISSVHQSKGLQFPVVLLADLRHRGRADTETVLYARGHGVVFKPTQAGENRKSERWVAAVTHVNEEREAEQRRLLYVAVTRAQREVIIFERVTRSGRRPGFAAHLEPWRERAIEAGWLAMRAAPSPALVASAPAAVAPTADCRTWAERTVRAAIETPSVGSQTLVLPVTTLETFLQCPRRGFLAHDLGLDEAGWSERRRQPPPDRDGETPLAPVARGRMAHAVLAAMHRCERPTDAGTFVDRELTRLGSDADDHRLVELRDDLVAFLTSVDGQRFLALSVEARRPELPFTLRLAGEGIEVVVHGQIDLLCWVGERPWVVDYKHAHRAGGADERYRLQLEIYALAAARLCGVSGDVRTSLVFLRDREPAQTEDVCAERRRELEEHILATARVISLCVTSAEAWPGRERVDCQRLACGFVARCHPPKSRDPEGPT